MPVRRYCPLDPEQQCSSCQGGLLPQSYSPHASDVALGPIAFKNLTAFEHMEGCSTLSLW